MIARAFVSLDRGRRAEQEVARRLSAWTSGAYRFRRRGLGHASLEDLVVEQLDAALPSWPFPISVKRRRDRGLPSLLSAAGRFHGRRARPWPPWAEIPASLRARAWLIWHAHRAWWLSCAADNPLAGLPYVVAIEITRAEVPGHTRLLDDVCGWPFRDFVARWPEQGRRPNDAA